ncbi:MAG: helix-turn-helix domain-containing protein [Phycisphaerae bacterium]|nr:helix-turn-helix domain-containing protein [Phycisphaerae bacterium]
MNADPRDPFAPTSFPPSPFAPPDGPAIGAPLSPTGQPGGPTPREMSAVKKFARAVLECVLAFNEGHLLRAGEKGLSAWMGAAPVPDDPGPEALLLTPTQAARRLAVSVKTLKRLTQPAGSIPVVRVGRQVRYAPLDLAAAVRVLQARKEP